MSFEREVAFMVKRRESIDENSVGDYLKSFDFFERYAGNPWEGDLYVETHLKRLLATLEYVPPLDSGARVLEIGAVPYYMTILLKRLRGIDVDTLSFYEITDARSSVHVVESAKYSERYVFDNLMINAERDPFPFNDGSYDLVLCCEVIEHLLLNPSHMLCEVHRTLRPGGSLLLTTPNVARRSNLLALLSGKNIYDRYHGNGIYGRHNREYTAEELIYLLKANNYEIVRLDMRDVYSTSSSILHRWCPAAWRDTIFLLARPVGQPRTAFPENLYVLMDEYRNVIHPFIIVGVNDVGQVGRGWYAREEAARCYRWTAERAEFYLKDDPSRCTMRLDLLCSHPDVDISPVDLELVINGQVIGTVVVRKNVWQEVQFCLGNAVRREYLECALAVSRTWVPKREIGTDDERRLGVAISRIWLE